MSAGEALALSSGETDARIETLGKALRTVDDSTTQFLQALLDDSVKVAGQRVFILKDGQVLDAVTGQSSALPPNAEDVVNNNRMRGALESALATLKLFSPDEAVRLAATKQLQSDADAAQLPLIEKALASETNPEIRNTLSMVRAGALLASSEPAKRLEAAAALSTSTQASTKTVLLERLAQESDPAVKAALQKSLRNVESALAWGDRLGALFSGISLGSILLLAALGLAITYGLMGVINMAHGELMMMGAYATYVVQGVFQKRASGLNGGRSGMTLTGLNL